MEKRRRIIIAVILMLSVINYSRLQGNESIRLVQFISIFAIGALSALLIREVVTALRAKKINKE